MIRSLVKPVNALFSGYSYLKSYMSGNPAMNGMPVSISTELTNHCNLSCPECITGSGIMKRARGFMDIGLFTRVMEELKPYLYNTNLYFQGEPMLHPGFFPFLETCRDTFTTLSTNGHFLSEQNSDQIVCSGLNKMIISLDGLDQEIYSAYRQSGNYTIVLEGIKNLAEARKRSGSPLIIEIQFIVNRQNEHQLRVLKAMAKNLRVDLRLKSMQVINKENIGFWLPHDEKYRRYRFANGNYELRSSFPDRCARLWFNPVITWDGKVVPCCFDKDADHIMGDLNQDSFREIWYGQKFSIFRKRVLSGRYMIEICRNCTSGLKGAVC